MSLWNDKEYQRHLRKLSKWINATENYITLLINANNVC